MTFTAGAIVMLALSAQVPPPAVSEVEAGRALFEGKGQCLSCHRVGDTGASTARDLSWIGLLRTPEKLRAAVTATSAHPSASTLSAADVDRLVAYLRMRRTLWALDKDTVIEREIAPATENAPFFDRPDRDKEERPDLLIGALHIRPGAIVADIGSGTGYFTWRLAQQVGPQGKVYAVDLQESMLDLTKAAVDAHKLTNVEYVRATERSPRLPDRSIDLAFVAYAYHEFGDPEAMMASIRRALKPGGRVVILEYAKESRIAPASPLHKMSFEEIRREIEPMGFAIDQLLDFLPVQHGVVFTIK
ncbi:MAG TPA: class I SAM-dependent methyltransferase [Vicinamibacterales bacterium]|nr:class I SAM-dependent methyltransferase [Vicinamibacterales bacterium]